MERASSSTHLDMCDIEFTIEEYLMLQTRVGKRTAEAAVRIACEMVAEDYIGRDDARCASSGKPAGGAHVPASPPTPSVARSPPA